MPAWDNSAMDGFAVRSADCAEAPAVLELVGTATAGGPRAGRVEPGTAIRIMTGARLPDGADGVCPIEEADVEGGGRKVRVKVAVASGTHVRRAGDDFRAGDVLVEAGSVVTPALVGLLAAAGVGRVPCHRTPVVGVLSTGDELLAHHRSGGSQPAPADLGTGIRDSNRAALLSSLALDRVPTVDLGVVPDRIDALASAVDTAKERCDALITTGGVSVGDRDIVRLMLERAPEVPHRWMQVAIKPAKPFAFAVFGRRDRDVPMPLFGLPGNPVSALVSYELFVRPALRQMAGHTIVHRPVVRARCAEPIRRRADGKLHLVASVARFAPNFPAAPSGATGGVGTALLEVRPNPRQGSHVSSSLSAANALCLVPDGDGMEAGAIVDVMLLDPASCFDPVDRGDVDRGDEA